MNSNSQGFFSANCLDFLVLNLYIQRLAQGGAEKAIRNLKAGIFEIKIPYASGLRVYFGKDKNKIILLLIGGDKKTQNRDIKKAREYWRRCGQQK
ncbi:MAG: type II toxin-antitoxin system RelE/ParE family toxin [Oligoflexia bacterium]|nr:type II toxin-antitoxin system RelE/ParE family toxin [Oligoflexia bacterium]